MNTKICNQKLFISLIETMLQLKETTPNISPEPKPVCWWIKKTTEHTWSWALREFNLLTSAWTCFNWTTFIHSKGKKVMRSGNIIFIEDWTNGKLKWCETKMVANLINYVTLWTRGSERSISHVIIWLMRESSTPRKVLPVIKSAFPLAGKAFCSKVKYMNDVAGWEII